MYIVWMRALPGSTVSMLPGMSPSAIVGIAAISAGMLGLLMLAFVKYRARRRAALLPRESQMAQSQEPDGAPSESEEVAQTAAPADQIELTRASRDYIASVPTTPLRDRSEWRVRASSPSRPLAPVIERSPAESGPISSVALADRGANVAEAPAVEVVDAASLVAQQLTSEAQDSPTAPSTSAADDDYQRGLELIATSSGSEPLLRAALVHFRRAQENWTREQCPERWAMVQNEIGRVYQELPVGDRATNLRTAIMHYQSALEVFDAATHAMNWAWTQSALGAIYQALPSGSPIANARAAVAHHQRALDVFTLENAPLAWAWNQNNLGAAYETMRGGAQGDHVANLRMAVDCYRAALRVYTPDQYRAHYEVVARNLARVQNELKVLE